MSRLEAKSERGRYEQFAALEALARARDKVRPSLAQQGLRSDSWLIRSITYRLLEEVHSHPYDPILIRSFQSTKDEHDKLLIADAMSFPLTDEAIQLFRAELMGDAPLRLKVYLAKTLSEGDSVAMAQWVAEEHLALDHTVLTAIIHFYADRLPTAFGEHGGAKWHRPGVDFFSTLLHTDDVALVKLLDDEYLYLKLAEDSLRILQARQLRSAGKGSDLRDLQMTEANERARKELEKMFLANERLQEPYRVIKTKVARKSYVQEASQRAQNDVLLDRIPEVAENILGEINLRLMEKDLSTEEIGSYSIEFRKQLGELLHILREEHK